MKFKSVRILQQYERLPCKLKEICETFVQLSKENGVDALVTRVCDPVNGESGVHPDHRAVDFRDEYFDGRVKRKNYSVELVEEIIETINNQYRRNDKFPTILHHSFHGGMWHFHIQIPVAWVTKADRERLKEDGTS